MSKCRSFSSSVSLDDSTDTFEHSIKVTKIKQYHFHNSCIEFQERNKMCKLQSLFAKFNKLAMEYYTFASGDIVLSFELRCCTNHRIQLSASRIMIKRECTRRSVRGKTRVKTSDKWWMSLPLYLFVYFHLLSHSISTHRHTDITMVRWNILSRSNKVQSAWCG